MSPPVSRNANNANSTSQLQNGFRMSTENLLEEGGGEGGMPPALPPLKPEWRHHMMMANSQDQDDQEEEAIPNDSLYGTQETVVNAGSQSWREKVGARPALSDMAHWSSHGYLARDTDQERTDRNSGYVVLKRQGENMVTIRSNSHQPSSLPMSSVPPAPENKYFSVRGYKDFTNKVTENFGAPAVTEQELNPKYFSVDAKFLNQHADMKSKLRENLRVSNTQQQIYGANSSSKPLPDLPQYYQPPPPPPSYPPYQRPPPPQRTEAPKPPGPPKPALKAGGSNLEASKAMSGSVSWLEWTQQLQAYIAWVNSQLRKRSELSAVQDLRTDLQSGEVLAQLIEIICKSPHDITALLFSSDSFVRVFTLKSHGKTVKYFDIDWFIWHPNITQRNNISVEIVSTPALNMESAV